MTLIVIMSNTGVVSAVSAVSVDMAGLVLGGLGFHVVDLEDGRTHWDTGMLLVPVCMAADVVSVSRGRVCISARSISGSSLQ